MTLQYLLNLIPYYAGKTSTFMAQNPACKEVIWTVDNINPDLVEQLAEHLELSWYRNVDMIALCVSGDGYYIHFSSEPVAIRQIIEKVK